MQLYTVSFTSKKTINRYDSKGKKIGSFKNNIKQTIHCLPFELAQKYQNRPNYRCKPFIIDDTKKNKSIEPFHEVTFKKTSPKRKTKCAQDENSIQDSK